MTKSSRLQHIVMAYLDPSEVVDSTSSLSTCQMLFIECSCNLIQFCCSIADHRAPIPDSIHIRSQSTQFELHAH